MYHISTDKRAQKSAALIWQGMEQCLQEKPFHKLRISDINQKSYVSRATFYRLFDSLQDVLVYQCDRIYSQLEKAFRSNEIQTKQDFFLLLIEKWMVQGVLIQTLVENNLTGILYDTHMKHRDFMKEVFQKGTVLSEREADYMVSLLANLIPAAMNIWYRHGKNESPGEVYYAVGQSLNIIKNQLFENGCTAGGR